MTLFRHVPTPRTIKGLCVGIGLAIIWLILRNAALETLSATAPGEALRFPPASGAALAAQGWSRILAAGGAADGGTRRLSREALQHEPSNASAIALAGMIASADGMFDRARPLMEAARDRDPRLASARYWLLDHDMRVGDFAAGLDEIGPALRLRAGTNDAVMALVMGLLGLPGGEAAVRAKLATAPSWRTDFFETEARLPDHARPLLALLGSLPPMADRDGDSREQRAVFSAAVVQDEENEAYRIWRARDARAATPGMVYDPDFRGLPGVAPFNWTLGKGDGATATIEPSGDPSGDGILNLSFEGAAPAMLAEQYILSTPGRSRFSFSFRARSSGEGGTARLAGQIRCSRGGAVLASITVMPAPSFAQYATDLAIPPACPAIRIQFRAAPADAPGRLDAQLTGVRLDRIG